MRFEKLFISGFGKLANKEIVFSEGLNIVYGQNESGKSTLQEYIKAMLFGISRGKKEGIPEKDKYKPFNGDLFGGSMDYSLDNSKRFRVWRDLNAGKVKIFDTEYNDISNEFPASRSEGILFAQQQLGVNSELFERTCFVSQLGLRLDNNSKSLIANRLSNYFQTGDEDASYEKALKILEKTALDEIGSERTKGKPINKIQDRIKKLEEEKENCSEILFKIRHLESKQKEIKEKEEVLKLEVETLELILKDKEREKQAQDMIISNENINALESEYKEKEKEIEKMNLLMPKGTAIFDDDIAKNVLNIEQNMINQALARKKYLIFSFFLALLICLSFLTFKDIKAYFSIFLIIPLVIMINKGKKLGDYTKKQKEELDEILVTSETKTIPDYFAKKRELSYILDKKAILKDAAAIIKNQIEIFKKNTNKDNVEEYEERQPYINQEPDRPQKNGFSKLVEADKAELERNIKEKHDQIREFELISKEIETEIRVLIPTADKLVSIEEELLAAKEKEKELKDFQYCVLMASELLKECAESIKSDILPDLSRRLSGLVYDITGKYSDIKMNDISGNIKVSMEDGNIIDAGYLSAGTIDQIYLSLRISAAQILSERAEKIPIIFDEAFSQFDEERLKRTAKILVENSKKNQIIIFTCRRQESNILMEGVPEANLIEL